MQVFNAPDESIWIGILRIVLTIPHARSKKDKRKVISKLRDRFRNRYNLSVAEVGYLENFRRSVIAIGMIGNDSKSIETSLQSRFTESLTLLDARVDEYQLNISPHSPTASWTPS